MASGIVETIRIGNYPNNVPAKPKNGIILSIHVSAIQRKTCCKISTVTQLREQVGEGEGEREREGREGYLVRDYYGWKVRRMVQDYSEMRKVALIQALAFHEPALVFDELFFQFFQAEVLSALIYRLRNSPPDRYACLVAEAEASADEGEVVGVVDATAFRDEAVLQHLPAGAQEYLYVSGIAVLNNFRRKKVGSALLEACEKLSSKWGMEHLVLRAYEDDKGALKLYGNAGYKIAGGDPPWMTTWIGRKRRVLMIKRPSYLTNW
ncbi:hypothetical protein NMG60_11025749 [Bertholletia excelsa]